MLSGAEIALVYRLFQDDIARQRQRMVLTVLAIAWGTLSIVMLLSFGEGMKRSMNRNKRGMGEGIAVVWPGSTTKPWAGLPAGRTLTFQDEDVELLRARIPEIQDISPEYAKRVPVSVGTKSVNARTRGVEPAFGEMRNLIPQPGGRFLDELDLLGKRRVIFLGDELATDLFGREDPVGRTVMVSGSPFVVVGVMQAKVMMGMYSGPDKKQASIPATTFKSMFTGERIANLVYQPRSPELGDQAKDQLYRVMARRYRFDPEDTRAIGVWDTRESQRITGNVMLGIQMFLGFIGALTLLVGGMGVANIMYAMVRVRTREIGVKMALGAKMRHVMTPFVLEALLMTCVGGALGTVVGLGVIGLIGVLPLKGDAFDFLGRPTFSFPIATLTTVVLGCVGLLAGWFPARRAAAVNPADSLRYE